MEDSTPPGNRLRLFVPAFDQYNAPGRIVTLGSYYPVTQVMNATGALRYLRERGESGYAAADVTQMHEAVQWTRWINELNRGRRWVLKRLFERLDPMLEKDIAVAVVPSHDPFQDTPPIRELARMLAANERIDATGCLVRHTKIKRIVYGGPSYRSLHRQTISVVDAPLLRERNVLLLDDIAKSGASLRACAEILDEAGARQVQPMALGRVVVGWPPDRR